MKEPLIPLTECMKANPAQDGWEAHPFGEEHIVYAHVGSRFRIIPEHPVNFYDSTRDLWRNDQLAERGIYASEEDAKDFAKQLMDTFFQHTSPHQMYFIREALDRYIREWEEQTGRKLNAHS